MTEEEFGALEQLPGLPEKPDPLQVFRDVKGVSALSPRALGVFRELIACREQIASELDLPPFRIAANEALLALARSEKDPGLEGLGSTVRRRELTARFHQALSRGLALSAEALPELERGRRIELPLSQQRRVAALKEWRKSAATRVGLDLSLVLPQRLIDRVAEAHPADLAGLAAIDGVRRWRVEAFGPEILRVTAKA